MALERTRSFYEFLIRGREDGSMAAHVVYRNRVVLDGEVLKDESEQPQAVDLENVGVVKAIVGDAIVAAAAAQDAAIAERDRAREEAHTALSESAARLAEEQARATGLEADLAATRTELEAARAELFGLQARVPELDAASN